MAKRRSNSPRHAQQPLARARPLRIIGGALRGRKIEYSGNPITRPMKDRVREAVFNVLGPRVAGLHAIDLFAGTGALGLEAISRGARGATFIERHHPTIQIIRRNAEALGVADICRIVPSDTFFWARTASFPLGPWLVLCSPPYELYVTQADEMLALIAGLIARASPGSIFVVESDQRLDWQQLPQAAAWDVRSYPPAKVGFFILPE